MPALKQQKVFKFDSSSSQKDSESLPMNAYPPVKTDNSRIKLNSIENTQADTNKFKTKNNKNQISSRIITSPHKYIFLKLYVS